jgi:hypothetical protein
MRKEDTSSLTAKDVGTLTTLETFARWTNWHLSRELLRTSSLTEVAAGVVEK